MSGHRFSPEYDKLPTSCTRVLIQPVTTSLWEQGGRVSQAREILSKGPDRVETVLLEPGPRDEERYGFSDALLDWLDVSAGGDAFWDGTNTAAPEVSQGFDLSM